MSKRITSVLVCTALASSLAALEHSGANTQGTAPVQAVKKYQARAPKTQPFGNAAFEASKDTTLRWLGMRDSWSTVAAQR